MPHALSRRRLVGSLAAGAGLGLAGLGGCRGRPASRLIGFIGGLTGSVSELGVEGRNGALLAAEELGARDGVTYELVPHDDRQDVATVREAVAALAARHVAFAVGPMTSAMAMAAVPVAQRLGLVLVSPTATTDELSGVADVFFRVACDSTSSARQLAQSCVADGGRRFAALVDARNLSYTGRFADAFAAEAARRGAQVATVVRFGETGYDLPALVDRLLAGRPDSVLIVAGVGDSALAAQHVRRRDPAVRLAITPWAANPRFIELGGNAVEGALAQQALDLVSTAPAITSFRQRYRDRFGAEVTTPAVQSYEALSLGVAALREATADLSLRAVLAQPGRHWPGLYSDIVLDAAGDTPRSLYMAQVRGGRFVAFAR